MAGIEQQPKQSAPGFFKSLSGRLLLLTIGFVMLAEVLIFVPSIAQFRLTYLEQRLANAQIASLVLLATDDNMVSDELRSELLKNAGAHLVALKRDDMRFLVLSDDMPAMVDARFDVRNISAFDAIRDAFDAMAQQSNRVILVRGQTRHEAGDFIEIVIDEKPLCAALIDYAQNIATLSLVISLITAGLVFLSLHLVLVRPLRGFTGAMMRFQDDPEDAGRIVTPDNRNDEMGDATRALAAMQAEVHNALAQKKRLAALGEAVSKINHDLRNILASLQLLSDRLLASDDPAVRNMAPRFIAAIDRAVALAQNTLRYGRAAEAPPAQRPFKLHGLIEEVFASLSLLRAEDELLIAPSNQVADNFALRADPDQIYRVLTNLVRNAVQAIDEARLSGASVVVRAEEDDHGCVRIMVEDTGPGLPEKAQSHLFEPFKGSARADGHGLGLAIAQELVQGHGGSLHLSHTGADGTCFMIELPQAGLNERAA